MEIMRKMMIFGGPCIECVVWIGVVFFRSHWRSWNQLMLCDHDKCCVVYKSSMRAFLECILWRFPDAHAPNILRWIFRDDKDEGKLGLFLSWTKWVASGLGACRIRTCRGIGRCLDHPASPLRHTTRPHVAAILRPPVMQQSSTVG